MNSHASVSVIEPGPLSDGSAGGFSIADLRQELGLSLEEFAARIGLGSKSGAHRAEKGEGISLPVALRIEQLSIRGGVPRIDAAAINPEVAAARASCPRGCFLGARAISGGDHA